MPELNFHTLDVFTDRIFGGNQLAVFPEAPALPDEVMPAIAREFNLSETVFVRPAEVVGALCQLRIFTPGGEIPFAGHPTVGTAQLLVELGIAPRAADGPANFVFEERAGLVPVSVEQKGDGGFFTWLTAPRLPERGAEVLEGGTQAAFLEQLASMLGLECDEILAHEQDAFCGYSAGVPFLFVPLRDRAALGRATLDLARWRETIANTWAEDLYLFCHENEGEVNIRARMFAPAMGIMEDPATGSAAAALAGYLWRRQGGGGTWIIAQGVEMGRPSTLHLEATGADGELQRVRVGGRAVRVSHGTLRLPDALLG